MTDHDQRFKLLLKEFFAEFVQLFFSAWADRFDFKSIEWLDQELFLDPPQGERRQIDLVAKLPISTAASATQEATPIPWLALVHVEVESAKKA